MRKTYHICISSSNEIYCRDDEDYIRCFNSLALAVAQTESSLLADSIMSNHIHECVRTDSPEKIIRSQRYKYSRYFNAKYHRKGRLGERWPFIIELEGLYHTLAALSYVFRNPVHHGISPTPFGYPHTSARNIFRKDLGQDERRDLLDKRSYWSFLPSHNKCPDRYKMSESGLLLRESVIDTVDVEHMYGTARTFLYYMNRISGEEWKREQEKDGLTSDPITMSTIENGIRHQTPEQMLHNEHGKIDYRRMNDMQLCHIIDKQILPDIGKESVYLLTASEKASIGRSLPQKYRLPESQIRRCLAIQ